MNLIRRLLPAVVLFSAISLAPADTPATRAAKLFSQDQFLRYTDDELHPRLEVSIVTLSNKKGTFTIDLVSAIHIADASYYADLNERFKHYDAVLYELVAPDGQLPEKNAAPHHPVAGLQKLLKSLLGLSYQLDEIDYTSPNFVHADMDPDEFAAAQEKRGESLLGLIMQAYMKQATNGPSTAPIKVRPLPALPPGTAPNLERRQLSFKRLLAPTMSELVDQAETLDGPDGSAIVTDRNDAALKVIRKQRKADKKHIALFYGAAHMPDMATQLVTNDKLKMTKTQWLTAWDLTAPATPPSTQR
jgi:hypothetical protein